MTDEDNIGAPVEEDSLPVTVLRRSTISRGYAEERPSVRRDTVVDFDDAPCPRGNSTTNRRSTVDVRAFMFERSARRASTAFVDPVESPSFYVPKTRASGMCVGLWRQLTCNLGSDWEGVQNTPLHSAIVVPLPLLLAVYALVIVSGVFVFIVNKPQPNGVSGTDFALPTAMLFVMGVMGAFSSSLGVTLIPYSKQYVADPRACTILQGHQIILFGATQIETINTRQYAQWDVIEGASRGAGFVDANTVLHFVSAAAATKSAPSKLAHIVGHFIVVLWAAVFGIAPSLPRIIHTRTMWGTGTWDQVAYALSCAILTFLCCIGIFSIYLMHIHTLRFMVARVRASETIFRGGTWGGISWPAMRVESCEGIMTWVRLRWALHRPTLDVYRVGQRTVEAMTVVAIVAYVYAAVVNALSSVNVGNTSGRSNTLEGSWTVALCFAVLNGTYTIALLSVEETLNTYLNNQSIDVHNRALEDKRSEIQQTLVRAAMIVYRSTKYANFLGLRVRWWVVVLFVFISAIVITLAVLRASLLV